MGGAIYIESLGGVWTNEAAIFGRVSGWGMCREQSPLSEMSMWIYLFIYYKLQKIKLNLEK